MQIESHKSFHIQYASKSAGNPDDAQLALINQYTLDQLGADDVYVRTAYLAHSGIDRDKDAFEKPLLEDFARTLPGKGLFVKHPQGWDGDSGPGIGRWFEASVLTVSQDEARKLLREPKLAFPEAGDAYLLQASYYIPRSEKNANLITDINAGVASDVSIGFGASKRTAFALDANENVAVWKVHAPGEAFEGSLVWLGAQPGARTVKSKGTEQIETVEDEAVELKEAKEKIKSLEDEKSQQAEEIKTLKASRADADNFKAVAKVAGTDDKPADVEQVKTLVTIGMQYQDEMVNNTIRAKRLNGTLGDDEEAINKAKAFYKSWPIDLLRAEFDGAVKALPKGVSLEGGEPNGGKGSTEKPGDQKDYRNPLDNPALKAA